ncbi:MAG TPA: hypothetical protein RMH85_17020 [Polyangiaceae bacterium LLY-WYZ-15_(1-7)]|nr:hypothetical protein [Polyangiaceae bacterium LLY-WYZ-15_(1-7)]HJL10204.1 hypothetical protein [Polyangiaceae bacterium LLY-WYZ-15_(1-7)]HJL32402.1 hypothetical protein [Polyangiaceae bacterium LLY-WYZ-15_(1-7)]HJL37069.1 hypothetical protein [Polyangiaceae bacterium LLY-WYZ-15_(1-7)]HJL50689.1 hypothetical protein [Polyangiaceae bacterium LLY-WYZ-15_(1-7)]
MLRRALALPLLPVWASHYAVGSTLLWTQLVRYGVEAERARRAPKPAAV